MKDQFLKLSSINDYLLKDLNEVDEYILNLTSFLQKGQGQDTDLIKTNLKRVYFEFKIQKNLWKTKGEKNIYAFKYLDGSKEFISKELYEQNKDFYPPQQLKLYGTSLNYEDFSTLSPLLELLNYAPELPNKIDLLKFVDLIKKKILRVEGDNSKSMIISNFIEELDRNHIILHNLLIDSLLPLNAVQKTVIQKQLSFNKETFRLLLIEYSNLFDELFSQFSYASSSFQKLAKSIIKRELPKSNSIKKDFGKGFKLDPQPPTNYKKAYELLKDGFISPDTLYGSFQNIFSTLKEREIEKQVVWNGSKKSLHYFIAKLKNEKNIINKDKYRKTVWQITERVFQYYDKEKDVVIPMTNVKGNDKNKTPKSEKIKLDKIIDCF